MCTAELECPGSTQSQGRVKGKTHHCTDTQLRALSIIRDPTGNKNHSAEHSQRGFRVLRRGPGLQQEKVGFRCILSGKSAGFDNILVEEAKLNPSGSRGKGKQEAVGLGFQSTLTGVSVTQRCTTERFPASVTPSSQKRVGAAGTFWVFLLRQNNPYKYTAILNSQEASC